MRCAYAVPSRHYAALLVPSLLARASTGADSSSAATDFPKPASIEPTSTLRASVRLLHLCDGRLAANAHAPAGYEYGTNWYLLGEANRSILHKILDDAAH